MSHRDRGRALALTSGGLTLCVLGFTRISMYKWLLPQLISCAGCCCKLIVRAGWHVLSFLGREALPTLFRWLRVILETAYVQVKKLTIFVALAMNSAAWRTCALFSGFANGYPIIFTLLLLGIEFAIFYGAWSARDRRVARRHAQELGGAAHSRSARSRDTDMEEALRRSAESYEKEQALARLRQQKEELMVQAHRELVSLRRLAVARLASSATNASAPAANNDDTDDESLTRPSRGAECIVCAEACTDSTAFIACDSHAEAEGHLMCKACFGAYAESQLEQETSVVRARGAKLRCPHWLPELGGCRGCFSDHHAAMMLPASLHLMLVEQQHEQVRAEEAAKQTEILTRVTAQLRAKLPGLSQELLARQLRDALPGAKQCGRCGAGPVMHRACSNLRTHHGDRAKDGRGHIDNSCRQCGWFVSDISAWPAWDGKVGAAAASDPAAALASFEVKS